MTALPPRTAQRVALLSSLLDEEIELLEIRSQQMTRLAEAILGRGEEGMEPVLAEMEHVAGQQENTDRRLRAARRDLAEAFGVEAGDLKLCELIDRLGEPLAADLDRQRDMIVRLAGRLRRQHLETSVLLAECSRVNRMLLEGLLPAGQTVTTYGRGGTADWKPQAGLLDTER